MIAVATKKCRKCETEKPLEDFHVQRSCTDGRRTVCKKCSKENQSRWARPKNGYQSCEKKFCGRCKKTKPAAEFYRNARHRDRLSTYCKECTNSLRPNYTKEENRDFQLKSTFGITRDDYNVMLAAQDGKCAICGTTTPGNSRVFNFSVDHNHETDEIRGLLCELCNRGLGHFGDDPERLEAAARYLRKHKAAPPKQSP